MFKIKKINLNQWELMRKTSSASSVFLSSEFIQFVTRSFKMDFIGLLAENKKQSFLLPCYIKGDVLEFQVGFIGYGGPLPVLSTMESFSCVDEIATEAKQYLGIKLSKFITYPSQHLEYFGRMKAETTYTDIIELKEIDYLFNNVFSGNVRTSIRKAQKNNVHVKKLPFEDFERAHKILSDTQKRVGASYCTDFNFFSLICQSEKHMALGAYIDDRLIGVSVFLVDALEVFYYLNGTDIEFRNFSQNYLMLWHAIKYSVTNNIKYFNLGASHYEELKKFKQKWGAEEYKILILQEN